MGTERKRGFDIRATGTIVTAGTIGIVGTISIVTTIGAPVTTSIIGTLVALAYQTPTTGTFGKYLVLDATRSAGAIVTTLASGIVGLIDTIDTDRPSVNDVKTARMRRFATNATVDINITKHFNGTFGRIPHIVISYTTRFIGTTALSGRK
jgi:hypothetical protein